jgi:hypothetical protein
MVLPERGCRSTYYANFQWSVLRSKPTSTSVKTHIGFGQNPHWLRSKPTSASVKTHIGLRSNPRRLVLVCLPLLKGRYVVPPLEYPISV